MPTLRLEIINELGEVGLTSLITVETKAEAWGRIKSAHRFYWPQGFYTRYSMPDEFEPRDYSALNRAFRELAEGAAAIMTREVEPDFECEQAYPCKLCGKSINYAELCGECAEGNDPFALDPDRHEYRTRTEV